VQADPLANQLGGQHVAFQDLADEKHQGDDGHRDPAVELRCRKADGKHQADHGADVGNEREEAGDQTDHQAEVEAGQRQADGVEDRQRQLLLPIFASAIVGGLGNPLGAIAGGFLIAYAEVLVTYPLKKVLGYLMPAGWEPDSLVQLLSTDYKFAVSFGILVIVLLFKPTGLFKGQSV
jgi:hypothetical protein